MKKALTCIPVLFMVITVIVMPCICAEYVPTVGSPLDEQIYQYSKMDSYTIGIYPHSYDYTDGDRVVSTTGIVNAYLPDALYGGVIDSNSFPSVKSSYDNDGYITYSPTIVLAEATEFVDAVEIMRYRLYQIGASYDRCIYSLNGIFTSGFGVDFQYALAGEWSYTVDGTWYTIYSTGSGDTYKIYADEYGVTESGVVNVEQWELTIEGHAPGYDGDNVGYIDRIFVGNIVFARLEGGGLISQNELPIFEVAYMRNYYNLYLDDEDMVGSNSQPYIVQFFKQYTNTTGDSPITGELYIDSNGVYNVSGYAGVNVNVPQVVEWSGLIDWLFDTFGAFMAFEIAPGWSLGVIMSIIVGLAVAIWAIRVFMGG